MIKVFYLIRSLAQGGAERQMAELVRRLPRDRYEPILGVLEPVNAYAHLLPQDQPRYVLQEGAPLARTLRAWLEAERPDIVHSFMERSNFWSRLVAPRAGSPVIVTSVRGPLMDIAYRLVEKLLARRSDAIVVNSVAVRDELIRWQRVSPSKIRVIANIVDLGRFDGGDGDVRRRVRADLGLDGTAFLVPGRVHIVKNPVAVALGAALLKRERRLPPDVTFLFAGRLDHPVIRRATIAVSRRFGIGEQVGFLGPRTDIAALYAAVDWVMLASFAEGLSNAALEAHACGRPLVLTRGANPDGIMEDGVTGYECRAASIRSIATAIDRAIRTPPDRAAAMGRLGRDRVRRMFDPGASFQSVLDLYEELLSARARSAR
jgi:L-malate glycosyltransferase